MIRCWTSLPTTRVATTATVDTTAPTTADRAAVLRRPITIRTPNPLTRGRLGGETGVGRGPLVARPTRRAVSTAAAAPRRARPTPPTPEHQRVEGSPRVGLDRAHEAHGRRRRQQPSQPDGQGGAHQDRQARREEDAGRARGPGPAQALHGRQVGAGGPHHPPRHLNRQARCRAGPPSARSRPGPRPGDGSPAGRWRGACWCGGTGRGSGPGTGRGPAPPTPVRRRRRSVPGASRSPDQK